jgi:hypothetical protein
MSKVSGAHASSGAWSLASLASDVTAIVALGTLVFFTIKINAMNQLQVVQYPNNLYMQMFQLLLPNLAALALSSSHYLNHKELRNSAIQGLRGFFTSDITYVVPF